MARPQRLKQLLLLSLRILAIMSLVFIMARPVLMEPGLFAQEDSGKVIILDNSLSMAYREEKGERYDLAGKAVRELLENFKGQVTLLPTGSVHENPLQGGNIPWMKSEEALREISSIPLSYGRGDLNATLSLALQTLKEMKMAKEIFIISDGTRGDWEEVNLSQWDVIPAEARMTLLRIGSARRDPNFTVKQVGFVEGEPVTGVRSRVEVTLSNLSDRSGTTLVQLFLSGIKVDQKSIDLKPNSEGKVYFELSFDKKGWVNGEVRLSGDNLPLDDIFYFPIKVRGKINVLIVDGAPKVSLKESESYYLVNALRPGHSEESPFIPWVVSEDELARIDINPYEVVVLMNVGQPQGSKLASILESGRPILLFLGNRVHPEEYNRIPLFPWKIGEVREADTQRPLRISHIDHHGFLTLFSGSGGESLRGTSFRSHFKVEGSMKTLLTLENKDPLLVKSEIGKSKIFLFTSSGDLDWNDFPLKVAYLPFIQGMVKEAAGLFKDSIPSNIRFGETSRGKVRSAQMIGPQGGPGIYQVFLPLGELRQGVNVPFEESDLGKLTDEEIKKKFGKKEIKIVEYHEGALSGLQTSKKEIWPYLLIFLFIVLGLEMLIANAPGKKVTIDQRP
jgi:hypothetical protein